MTTLKLNLPAPTIHGTNLDDDVQGTGFGERIYLGAGGDKVQAKAGDDQAFGGDGNDSLYGDGGDDSLYGERGDDRLVGGVGDDLLSGGPGSDRFVIGNLAGRDTILDFDPDAPLEVIDLRSHDFGSLRELLHNAQDVEGGVLFRLDPDTEFMIARFSASDLQADWFAFV